MREPNTYWHVYGREQIKPQWRGRLVYLLEIPRGPGAPVLRHVFDPEGVEFPPGPAQIANLLRRQPHGIVYQGVSKGAVHAMVRRDPSVCRQDESFLQYNLAIVRNSQEFLLHRRVVPQGDLRLCMKDFLTRRRRDARITEGRGRQTP